MEKLSVILPKWAKQVRGTPIPKIEVDPDVCYPAFFKELGVEPKDIDQYWLEVAYQCMKMELQRILGFFAFEIRVRAHRGRKDRWALNNHPPGKGANLATLGREAREHYKRLRGVVPG